MHTTATHPLTAWQGWQIRLPSRWNPLKLEGSVTDGIVSAVREVPNVGKIIQITAPISHGNSGSPVFNMKGEVVGVVTVKVTNGQNINLAIGAQRVAQLQPGQLRPMSRLSARERLGDVALGERAHHGFGDAEVGKRHDYVAPSMCDAGRSSDP